MTKNKKAILKRQKRELELYIHIPFCVQKCKYCDFLSAPAEKRVQNAYMEALSSEVCHNRKEAADCQVVSVFIGGGTPSVVDAGRIAGLMEEIRASYTLAEDAEISMEVNPGTVTRESLDIYRAAGINRLSIGCQSACDAELKRIGRIHGYGQFLDAYRQAREAGFANVNVDLMSALPGQTLEDWEETLRKVLALEPVPEHISAYSLIVEEGTPFYELYKSGELALVDEDTEREMYWLTHRILEEAGYGHYEISNYAKPGYPCRHNCGYWQRRDYLGFGVGAASLLQNTRFRNADSLKRYLGSPVGCREQIQRLGRQEQMEETMFLGLRMAAGVDMREFEANFGVDIEEIYGAQIRKQLQEGLLEKCGDALVLTRRGVDVSNYVMAEFLLT